jgi:hypothetical protein
MAKYEWHTDQIKAAESLMRQGGIGDAKGLYDALNCYQTSTNGDVALITWHFIYHTGSAPRGVRTSRGHSYRAMNAYGLEYDVRVADCYDHRNGVVGTGYAEVNS